MRVSIFFLILSSYFPVFQFSTNNDLNVASNDNRVLTVATISEILLMHNLRNKKFDTKDSFKDTNTVRVFVKKSRDSRM